MLDAGRRVVTRRDAEMETGPVDHASGKGNAELMLPELVTGALASQAGFRPCFTAAAADTAGAPHRHLQWEHGAETRFPARDLDGCAQCRPAFVGNERVPHAIDGRRHRRKVDDDFVGKAAPVLLAGAAERKAPDSP